MISPDIWRRGLNYHLQGEVGMLNVLLGFSYKKPRAPSVSPPAVERFKRLFWDHSEYCEFLRARPIERLLSWSAGGCPNILRSNKHRNPATKKNGSHCKNSKQCTTHTQWMFSSCATKWLKKDFGDTAYTETFGKSKESWASHCPGS